MNSSILHSFGRRIRLGMLGGGLDSVIGETHRIAFQADGLYELCAGCFAADPRRRRRKLNDRPAQRPIVSDPGWQRERRGPVLMAVLEDLGANRRKILVEIHSDRARIGTFAISTDLHNQRADQMHHPPDDRELEDNQLDDREPADQEDGARESLQANQVDSPSADRGEGGDRVDPPAAPSGSRIEPLDQTRKLIFHRFDPKTKRVSRHHFQSDGLDFDPSVPPEPPPVESNTPAGYHEIADNDPTRRVRIQLEQSESERSETLRSEDDGLTTHHATRHAGQSRRSDPVRHTFAMLIAVFVMLAAARFVLPGIVEEIRYAQHRGQLRAEFEVASEGLKQVSLDSISQVYEMVSDAAGPSVVHIDIQRGAHYPANHPDVPGAPSILISDQGSGVVVDHEGYILTNRHVVATNDEISVTLSDGRKEIARVVGTDELTDLALLKVNAGNLIPIPWGDSDAIRVGSPVWAIGSPFGLDRTITFGILSGKHRVVRAKDRYQDFMQSDVAVNPGNSGGPLVDSRGTLIGINTAIVGDTYQGVSFSIPSKVAKKIYQRLRENGSIERGWLGVSLGEVGDEQLPGIDHRLRGALILALADANSGAAQAGLLPGDIITRVDSEAIRGVDHLMQVIGNAMAGTKIKLQAIRDDQEMQFEIVLGRRPDPPTMR